MSGWYVDLSGDGVDVCLSAILFPIAVTVYVTWWFLDFFDAFFSPLYKKVVGFEVFGLGFVTSMVFIFATGTDVTLITFVVMLNVRCADVLVGRWVCAFYWRMGYQATPFSQEHLLSLQAGPRARFKATRLRT